MNDPELIARLAAIEKRLESIERHVPAARERMTPPLTPPMSPPPPPSSNSADSAQRPAFEHTMAAWKARTLANETASAQSAAAPDDAVTPTLENSTSTTDATALTTTEISVPLELEHFLGVKVAAWVGSIVVIIAIAVFAKFVIDQGWLTVIAPSVKLALAYALAGAFIAAGELLRSRIGRVPSASLIAAGVGGLYASTCAGLTPLDVFGPAGALIAGCAVAIIGGAITWRSREVAIGVISVLGAYIVPAFANLGVLMRGDSLEQTLIGALYLTAVYAVPLVLMRFGPRAFSVFRFFALLQGLAGIALLGALGSSHPGITIGFTALWWAMCVGDCVMAAMQGRSARSNVAFTIGATSLASTLSIRGVFAPTPWVEFHAWLPLGLAIACGAATFQLRTLVPTGEPDEIERREDRRGCAVVDACSRLSFVLAILVGALLLAQIGLLVRGGALAVSWTAMGAAGIFIGRRLNQRNSARMGLASVILGIAATIVAAFEASFSGINTVFFAFPSMQDWRQSLWGMRLDDALWAPLMVACALLFAARSWSLDREHTARPSIIAGALTACAAILWSALALNYAQNYASIAVLLAIPVVAVFAGRSLSLIRVVSVLWACLAALGWLLITSQHVMWQRDAAPEQPSGAIVLAAVIVGVFALIGRRFREERFSEVPIAMGFTFGLVALGMLIMAEVATRHSTDSSVAGVVLAANGICVVGSIGAIFARTAKHDLVEGVGLFAAAMSVFVWTTCLAFASHASSPGDSWLQHWLLNLSVLTIVPMTACGLIIRGGFRESVAIVQSLKAIAGLSFMVVSSSLIWRFFEPTVSPFGASATLQHSALSVWLALLAVSLVMLGFRKNAAQLRYVGLALIGLVALKVLIFDMRNADTMWRVLALLIIGLLLVVTSVVYSKAARANK